MGVLMEKPKFDQDQVIRASDVPKKFASIRKQAKNMPLVITDNGKFDAVIINYETYENMYSRLIELEEQNELRVLSERLERLEKNPEIGVKWRDIRRSSK
ncbi:MAG: type II toxin-antitoxin system Phd/YefM family antitoxin [Syntrophomonadaceae bacterium]|nr:type II toxin-antitoxin system Phd/YefM family antitoxin [Syntrophomonadaceae bacterium]